MDEQLKKLAEELGIEVDREFTSEEFAEYSRYITEAKQLIAPLILKYSNDPATIPAVATMALAFSMVAALDENTTREKAIEIVRDMAPLIANGYIIMREDFKDWQKKRSQ